MTQILDYDPDQLTGNNGQWQAWQYSAYQFMRQNRIDLTDYLAGSWVNSAADAASTTYHVEVPTFYQLIDGSALIRCSLKWNDVTPIADPSIPLFDFSSNGAFWTPIFDRYSTVPPIGKASIFDSTGGGINLMLPVGFSYTGNTITSIVLGNTSTPQSFDDTLMVGVEIRLMPYFGDIV